MKMRPHHLLCTQCYSGKGYSSDFIVRMDEVTAQLRSDDNTTIELVCSTDDICTACPKKLGEDLCAENATTKEYDRKVLAWFGLQAGTQYCYQQVTEEIRQKMTPEILQDICGACSWLPISACRRVLLSDFHLQQETVIDLL